MLDFGPVSSFRLQTPRASFHFRGKVRTACPALSLLHAMPYLGRRRRKPEDRCEAASDREAIFRERTQQGQEDVCSEDTGRGRHMTWVKDQNAKPPTPWEGAPKTVLRQGLWADYLQCGLKMGLADEPAWVVVPPGAQATGRPDAGS